MSLSTNDKKIGRHIKLHYREFFLVLRLVNDPKNLMEANTFNKSILSGLKVQDVSKHWG